MLSAYKQMKVQYHFLHALSLCFVQNCTYTKINKSYCKITGLLLTTKSCYQHCSSLPECTLGFGLRNLYLFILVRSAAQHLVIQRTDIKVIVFYADRVNQHQNALLITKA